MRLFDLGAMAACALTVTACGGPTVADLLDDEVTLSLSARSSQPELVALGESEGGLAVSRVVVRATSITFGSCRTGVSDLVLDARAYDLLAKDAPYETVSTAVTELCRVEVDLGARSESSIGGLPEAATVFVDGEDELGAQLERSSERAFSLRFEAADGPFRPPLLLSVDLAVWLADLPPPEAEEEATEATFVAQLVAASALYSDTDGDHLLDDDESTPLASAETL
jgi:hypothetical protein